MSNQPPPLDYQTPPSKSPRRIFWILLFEVLVVGFAIFALMPVTSRSSHGISDRAMCASNMHQIGLAILLYQNDFGGVYPPSVDELLENEQITPQVFICPDSNDTAAAGPTTQAVIADLHKPGHLSYIYIGQGLTDKTVTDDMVVLYEPLTNHAGDGMNLLFGDGHAEWFDATIGKQIIAAAATGRRVHLSSAGVVTTTPVVTTMPTTAVSPSIPFSPR
jgi:prepilin-type processing-associated H-X9-DG protein